jgi:alcohol dehydrogenase (cytochrome c)
VQPVAGREWRTVGGTLFNERYSTLNQINTSNVGRLTAAWMVHLHSGIGSQYSLEGTPVVQNGVMYLPSGNDDTFAFNAATGKLLWEYRSHMNPKITTICCGWDNRGVAVGQGLVFLGQLDGSFVALNQHTGKLVWKTQVARWQDGYTITSAPTYYNGVVYIGLAGGEYGVRGRLTALDAQTGKTLWRFYTTAGPGDVGGNTWPAHSNAYLHGGATLWNAPAIDPKLGLLYFSTGNAGPDLNGSVRPGDNLYSASILALHMNGKLAWYFQEVHHDIWDFDAPSPVVLFDTVIHGRLRHGIAEVGKTGWVYLLDRTNGMPLIGIKEKPVPQEPHQHTAATQPYPVGDATIPQCAQRLKDFRRSACIFEPFWHQTVVFAPFYEGGTVQSPMAYSPQTRYLYVAGNIWPFAIAEKDEKWTPGGDYTSQAPSPEPLGAKLGGTLTAIKATTNRIAWQVKSKWLLGEGSGTLATAGGLLFNGQPDGHLVAYDARTGQRLWQWQTGYGADAPAMTYEINGVQYVAIAAGGNSLVGSKNGDALWAFSLKGPLHGPRLTQAVAPHAPPTVVGFRNLFDPLIKTNKVEMVDFSFVTNPGNPFPSTRNTIVVGTRVTWVNLGTQPHTATSVQGGRTLWNTGMVPPGGSASIVFNKPGVYNYFCIPHPWMTGQIVVTPRTTTRPH